MGIVEAAKSAKGHIITRQELLEKEPEMLRIIYEHHAISEAEYLRSVSVLRRENCLREAGG
mgnify:CR=1 FL=1